MNYLFFVFLWFYGGSVVLAGVGNGDLVVADGEVSGGVRAGGLPDFTYAAGVTRPTVVNVRASYSSGSVRGGGEYGSGLDELLKEFFGGDVFKGVPRGYNSSPSYFSNASGVIVSEDGYVITSNHVIYGADSVEVTLDSNRRYRADVIGYDRDTDLALLKIDAVGLSYLSFGSSDNLSVGEWVLAVGNPFGFTSTVTQGIVSAKARNLDNIAGTSRINSFIQTDAAVNRGNSGGPLVNLRGELIGINTIIATTTGDFSGYAFAVPSVVVRRVFNDLKLYGYVDRGILGVKVMGVGKILDGNYGGGGNSDLVDIRKGLEKNNILSGVYISSFDKGSCAYAAGLRKGDVIIGVNDVSVKDTAQLHEAMSGFNPGDRILISFYRGKKRSSVLVSLNSLLSNRVRVSRVNDEVSLEGGVFTVVSDKVKARLKLTGGVYLKSLTKGKLRDCGVRVGYVITKVNKEYVNDLDHFVKCIRNSDGGPMLLEGVSGSGKDFYCVFKP